MTPPDILSDRRRFEDLVGALLRNGGEGSYGKLHLVCIQSMVDLGPRGAETETLLAKAVSITEQILRRRLSGTDACLRLAEGQYLLLFPNQSAAEGHVRAMALSQEIRQHLVGGSEIGLDVVAQMVPLSQLQAVDGEDLVARMDAAARLAAQPHGLHLSVEFQGVWDGKHQRLIGNRARIRRDFGGQVMYEAATLFAGNEDPLALDVNEALVHAAGGYGADRGVLFLPLAVNGAVLEAPGALERAVTAVSARNAGHVVFELSGTIAQLPRHQLREVVRLCRARGGKAGVRMMPDRDTARVLREAGVEFLCINTLQARQAGFTDLAVQALLTVVARDTADFGFHLCLWNADTGQEVKYGQRVGFHFFSGAVISPSLPLAAPPRLLQGWQIYT